MSFKEIKYNEDDLKTYLNSYIVNENLTNYDEFKKLLTQDYINISGSSILQILQNEYYSTSDLDIYIELNKINNNINKINEVCNLIKYLVINFNSISKKYRYMMDQKNFIELNNRNIHRINNLDIINPYRTRYHLLNNHIKLVNAYTSANNKKIDIIFIDCDIETLIKEMFDFDIVMNYWNLDKIYSLNITGIKNKIATMTMNYFKNKILLRNGLVLNKFFRRYIKYYNRKYKIYINKTLITNNVFSYIIYILSNEQYCDYLGHNHIERDINNIIQIHSWISLYNDNNQNNTFICCINKKAHILKYLAINQLISNYKFRKNIKLYSESLINKYYNPNSEFLLHKVYNEWDNENNINQIGYINKKNKLIFYRLT